MLYPANDYLLHVIKEETARQYRREVEIDRLADASCPRQPDWLNSQTNKVLHNVGHRLLALGQRLERVETRAA
jgi:hypothetical protein